MLLSADGLVRTLERLYVEKGISIEKAIPPDRATNDLEDGGTRSLLRLQTMMGALLELRVAVRRLRKGPLTSVLVAGTLGVVPALVSARSL